LQFPRSKRIPAHVAAATLTILAIAATGAAGALAAAGSGGIGTGGDTGTGTGDGTGGGATDTGEGVFPVRGNHTYGDGLGAGRGHDGQDLMAKCGKSIVSAYPGRVQTTDYHGSAGNYVVIDGAGQLKDTAYMHLESRRGVREGQRVEAGEEIGTVGDTGNASACHLHFEIWSNPGYYEGGHPIDPEPYLRAWDRKR
jgi:murein DD-endopeptidase MepM/ murein hydrolase activator NlpD